MGVRWRALVAMTISTSCGRIAFDPILDANPTSGADTGGATGTGENCSAPAAVTIGVPLTNRSIGAVDDIPGGFGSCATGLDVVYSVTVATPTNVTVEIASDFNGGLIWDASCPPTSLICQSLVATTPYANAYSLSPGTSYFVISKSGGSGTSFDLSVSAQ
jgi:hypothetical protein